MKLGIFGDSFADLNPYDRWDRENGVWPWPNWLAESLNKELICTARSSSALWYSYEKFVTHFDECDTIVFCYTNHLRFNGLPEEYSGLSNLLPGWQDWVASEDYEVARRIFAARQFMQNDNLQLFVYKKVFEEVNDKCLQAGKKLVNLMPFEGMNKYYNLPGVEREIIPFIVDFTKSQFPSLVNLFDVSAKETYQPNYPYHNTMDKRHCHLSAYNNKVLAKIILETFDKPKEFVYDLYTHTEFKYDEN